jgi:hypothetical protein
MNPGAPSPSEDGVENTANVLDSLPGWAAADGTDPEPPVDGAGHSTTHAEREIAYLAEENDNLRVAIDGRAVIEQAKGALMLRYGLDQTAAFAVLRRLSQDSNIKVHTIAETLVNWVSRDEAWPPAEHSQLAPLLENLISDISWDNTAEE